MFQKFMFELEGFCPIGLNANAKFKLFGGTYIKNLYSRKS